MRCTCHRAYRGHGWTHVGPDCPDCRTCWACCNCVWHATDVDLDEALHQVDLKAGLTQAIRRAAALNHDLVKGRIDRAKAAP